MNAREFGRSIAPLVCAVYTLQRSPTTRQVGRGSAGREQIAEGAFGFVVTAKRKEDDIDVVVKFLRKASVLKDGWIEDEELGRVPLEISLLARIAHSNIVEVSLTSYVHR